MADLADPIRSALIQLLKAAEHAQDSISPLHWWRQMDEAIKAAKTALDQAPPSSPPMLLMLPWITDRVPTSNDADCVGDVIVYKYDIWCCEHWRNVALGDPWLAFSSPPKPESEPEKPAKTVPRVISDFNFDANGDVWALSDDGSLWLRSKENPWDESSAYIWRQHPPLPDREVQP